MSQTEQSIDNVISSMNPKLHNLSKMSAVNFKFIDVSTDEFCMILMIKCDIIMSNRKNTVTLEFCFVCFLSCFEFCNDFFMRDPLEQSCLQSAALTDFRSKDFDPSKI